MYAMRMRKWLTSLMIPAAALMIFFTGIPSGGSAHAVVLTFDDLTVPGPIWGSYYYGDIPTGYGGFNWGGMDVNTEAAPPGSYINGASSGSQFATWSFGDVLWLTFTGEGTFDWSGAYFHTYSGFAAGSLTLDIEGYKDGTRVYNPSWYSLSYYNPPKWIEFNWQDIDQIRFSRVRGNDTFQLDDFTFTPSVPLPGAVWLLGSGLIGIVGLRSKFKK